MRDDNLRPHAGRSSGLAGSSERTEISAARLTPLALGTILSPLNSSMVAVALFSMQRDFGVSISTVTWVISAFYLAACVGQPLMGRFADRFGPRRVLVAGMMLVAVSSVIAPFAPNFGVVLACRVVQALGTSAAYPSAMTVLRREHDTRGSSVIATVNILGAALGPVLGGVLVAIGGWGAIFWVNLPLSLTAVTLALLLLKPDPPATVGSAADLLQALDLPGVTAFTTAMVGLLIFLLSLGQAVRWWALPMLLLGGATFIWWELRAPEPFIDVRRLWSHRALLGTYGQFVIFNVVYYGAFYGLPQWLEGSRGYPPETTGLLLLPIAGLGAVATAITPRIIRRVGIRGTVLVGSVILLVGVAGILTLTDTASAALIVAVGAILGIPYGLTNLGLQEAMNIQAPRELAGVAAGLFQTARYIGAMISTTMIGLLFGSQIGDPQLHHLSWTMFGVTILLLTIGLSTLRRPPVSDDPGSPRP